MRQALQIVGQRFNKLVVLRPDPDKNEDVVCQCDCGTIHKARASHVLHGRIKSCGCLLNRLHNVTLDDVLARCDKRGPDECWPWTGGAIGNHGYGTIRFRGVDTTAPRAVMLAIHGSIQKGMIVCHKCDNPPCCNPAHLFLGTYKDNAQDMLQKGRGNHVGGSKLKYCRAGLHLLDETQYIVPSTGSRLCRICMRDRQNAWRRAKHRTTRLLSESGAK